MFYTFVFTLEANVNSNDAVCSPSTYMNSILLSTHSHTLVHTAYLVHMRSTRTMPMSIFEINLVHSNLINQLLFVCIEITLIYVVCH